MCSVLVFSSESDKLRSLFSESNHFDSVLFIFDGGRRYKVSASSLGIHSPQDLLLPLGCLLLKSIGKQLKSNLPSYKPFCFILITLSHNKKVDIQ